MYNIILIVDGAPYFVTSVELASNAGDLIFAAVMREKERLEGLGVRIAAVVGDNATGVQNALMRFGFFSRNYFFVFSPNRVEAEDPTCLAIRCAAHSFQLLLKDVEDTPLVQAAMQTTEKVLRQTEGLEIQRKLKEVQKIDGAVEGKLPIKPVDTRLAKLKVSKFYVVSVTGGRQRFMPWRGSSTFSVTSLSCWNARQLPPSGRCWPRPWTASDQLRMPQRKWSKTLRTCRPCLGEPHHLKFHTNIFIHQARQTHQGKLGRTNRLQHLSWTSFASAGSEMREAL